MVEQAFITFAAGRKRKARCSSVCIPTSPTAFRQAGWVPAAQATPPPAGPARGRYPRPILRPRPASQYGRHPMKELAGVGPAVDIDQHKGRAGNRVQRPQPCAIPWTRVVFPAPRSPCRQTRSPGWSNAPKRIPGGGFALGPAEEFKCVRVQDGMARGLYYTDFGGSLPSRPTCLPRSSAIWRAASGRAARRQFLTTFLRSYGRQIQRVKARTTAWGSGAQMPTPRIERSPHFHLPGRAVCRTG